MRHLTLEDIDNPLHLHNVVIGDIRQHAMDEWPKESCGVVLHGKYEPLKNLSPEPEESFLIDQDVWSKYDGRIVGFVHSHCRPRHGLEPSATDMVGQIASDLPWAITLADEKYASPPLWWGDFRLDQPLLNRPFLHGVLDCYALIRSYYWQEYRILLDDIPRDNAWWENNPGQNLYTQNFGRVGFREVDRDGLKVGDVLVFRLKGKVGHHAGIFLGNDQIVHHLAGILSEQTLYNKWRPFIVYALRHKNHA